MRRVQRPRVLLVAACCLLLAGCSHKAQPWVPNPIHTPPQPNTGEFNVVWDRVDVSGFPADPYWAAQAPPYPAQLPPLTGSQFDEACVEQPYLTASQVAPGKQACTAEATVIDRPDEFPNILCFLEPGSTVHGHVDWTAASATGYVSWLNFADDSDYNFRLVPVAQTAPPQQDRGLTSNNSEIGGGDTTRYIELEFASAEVADNFHTPWWQGLAKLVDPLNLTALQNYLHPANGKQDPVGVTVGLFGLDCEHGCRSEFHPVYALAVQVREDPNDNVWAIFVRNWGDEGFCSSLNHEMDLPQNKMSLLLPWTGAKGLSTEVEQVFPAAGVPDASLLQDAQGNGIGALVTFTLPQPAQSGMTEAVIHFHWKGGTASPPRTRIAPLAAGEELAAPQGQFQGEEGAERGLRDLRQRSGVAHPAAAARMQPPTPVGPTRPPVKLKTKKYRLSNQPAQVVALTAAPGGPVECGGPGHACPVNAAKKARDIAMWKQICAGLNGNYPEDKYPGITKLCNDPRLK